ncbi:fimbrial protein [Escherichia coli]|nr:fimbrial protein [Escherichia coli]
MLNIIHYLKTGIFLPLFFLISASVLAHPQIISLDHRQQRITVGVTEFTSPLYVPDAFWHWQPRVVWMNTSGVMRTGLTTDKDHMDCKSRRGQDFYIPGGHTALLTTAHPRLQSSETLLLVRSSSLRIVVWGKLFREQERYEEIMFMMHHLLAWQEHITGVQNWGVFSDDVTPGGQMKRQLWQASGYECAPDYAGLTVRPDAFISGAESLLTQENDRQYIAGAEESVKRWQENLSPMVYF